QCRGAIGSIADRAPVNIINTTVFGSRTTGIEATNLTLGNFSGNHLSGNQEYGIRVFGENVSALDIATDYSGSQAVVPDGTVTPNGIPYTYIRPGAGGVTSTDRVHVWKNPGVAYHLAADAPHYTPSVLDIAADTRVLVEEGTTILIGPDVSLSVKSGAVLHLSGTEENPVIMTADSSEARPGHWKGFVFQDGGLIAQHAAI